MLCVLKDSVYPDLTPTFPDLPSTIYIQNAGITFLSPVWKCWCVYIHCPQCGSITFVYASSQVPTIQYHMCLLYCSSALGEMAVKSACHHWLLCEIWSVIFQGKYFRRLLDTCGNIFLSSTSRYLEITVYSLTLWPYCLLHLNYN